MRDSRGCRDGLATVFFSCYIFATGILQKTIHDWYIGHYNRSFESLSFRNKHCVSMFWKTCTRFWYKGAWVLTFKHLFLATVRAKKGIEFIEVQRQAKYYDESVLKSKSELFFNTAPSFKGYDIIYRGLSLEDIWLFSFPKGWEFQQKLTTKEGNTYFATSKAL